MPARINVLYLAAEAEPFVKIGGLADVAGSLPIALRTLPVLAGNSVKFDVRLVLPLHRTIESSKLSLRLAAEYSINRSGDAIPVQVYETSSNGLPVYFISGTPIINTPSVYSTDMALDREKYTFFSIAALKMIQQIGWKADIVHANDWHTALTLYTLRCNHNNPSFASIRSVITIHNLPYMGGDCSDVLSGYGIPSLNDFSLPGWAQTQPLPLGLWSADSIVPVSPTYANEILTPEFGCGLDPYLMTRSDSMVGILNGLDVNYWNPETDPFLPARFSPENFHDRIINKTTLQKRLELKEDPQVPLLVMIGRIDLQKGQDITFEVLRILKDRNWQFIILGSGDPVLENAARTLEAEFPDRVRAVIRFDVSLGHLLYGGADLFLMPSRYEPCGLAQMIAMHYGCVPLVRATGGLIDTVLEGKTGFHFHDHGAEAMVEALSQALDIFVNPDAWHEFQRRGMMEDFSWSRSALKYANIYYSLLSENQLLTSMR